MHEILESFHSRGGYVRGTWPYLQLSVTPHGLEYGQQHNKKVLFKFILKITFFWKHLALS